MNVVVAGTGYVGLVTGVALSEIGHNVTCVDIDEKKIEQLRNGIVPIYEKDLEMLLNDNLMRNKIAFTTNYKRAYSEANLIIVCVPTPEREDGSANLDYLFKASKQIAVNVKNECIIVIKSTVPIGTSNKIEDYLRSNSMNNVKFEVVSNPEFLSQGSAVRDTFKATRIVIGTESEEAKDKMIALYKDFHQPFVITNRSSAEMIKYASNDFLALKISFINDIANVCELVGANIDDVAKGMSYDDRIGPKFLQAGIGYGGSCFPKDTKALHWLASEHGYELKTIKAAIEVNENQRFKLIKKAKTIINRFKNLNVAVLGATFKPGTDDLREAPSIPNIKYLIEEGATVTVYDPVGTNNLKEVFANKIRYTTDIEKALKDADVCFIFTEWEEIKVLKQAVFKKLMKRPLIFDGRNCYKLNKMSDVEYYSIGR